MYTKYYTSNETKIIRYPHLDEITAKNKVGLACSFLGGTIF